MFSRLFLEKKSAFLSGELRDDDASNVKSLSPVSLDQPQYIGIIGDPQISAHFIFLDILCADHDHDFRLVCSAAFRSLSLLSGANPGRTRDA